MAAKHGVVCNVCAGTSIGGDNVPVCYELSAGWHVGGLGKWGQWTHARGPTVDVEKVLSTLDE